MIEIRDIDDLNCPVIICDRCRVQITEARGNVEWSATLSGPGKKFRIVHKRLDCQSRADDEHRWPYWMELADWLEYLLANSGLSTPPQRRPRTSSRERREEAYKDLIEFVRQNISLGKDTAHGNDTAP